jgi:hypothetical protein
MGSESVANEPAGQGGLGDKLGPDDPSRVADRYQVERLLGRGGMASVYRARDTISGNTVALKVLSVQAAGLDVERSVELFEREFHTLVQLAHPRVVQAYDYGVDEGRPYYTMELLDGGDLRELARMPWQEVCKVAYEMCSALSLLHSRGLVHRDVTPRNIRRTADGKAKLLDFGVMSAMGPTGAICGTPPFIAPEVLNKVCLDGRSDLFSLGATLYWSLTGRVPFSARRFEQLRDAWRSNPPAPSTLVEGIPHALEDVILSMLRIDADSRPKTAAEVMNRLLPLLETPPNDELGVAHAYLTTPRLVGRDDIVERFRKQLVQAMRRRGNGFVIVGDAGTGRSRMLDTFVLESKLVGATIIRAGAADATKPFGVAGALVSQLYAAAPSAALAAATPASRAMLFEHQTASAQAPQPESDLPKLVDVTRSDLDRVALQGALRSWLLQFANKYPLAIAVDDIDSVDEPSASLLASLSWEAKAHKIVYAVTMETGARDNPSTAVELINQHATIVEVCPLDLEQTTELLGSVFGDVPNLQLLSRRLHALCEGRPRDCMILAQFLVDQGAITYGGGSWTLPSEIGERVLPATIEEALRHRIASLSVLARRLAALLALGIGERLSRTELMRIEGAAPEALDRALDELVSVGLLSGDLSGYALRDGSLARFLTASLADADKIHEELANIYERDSEHPIVVAHHKLLGTDPEAGLDYILARANDMDARVQLSTSAASALGPDRTARTLELALGEAERRKRPRRELQALWVMIAGMAAQGEDARYYYEVPPAWLEQLKHDSGWNDWQKLDANLDLMTRAMMAVGAAAQRYSQQSEAERVLAPPDAIKQLVSYVVFSIAVSVRVLDLELMASLPPLLEPFAPLNPMVSAMLNNARGTRQNGQGKREQARETFLGVLRQLDDVAGAELAYVEKVRASLSQTLAEIDASLGIRSTWTERLADDEQDPNQMVGARYLRKVEALQQGDWEAAEAHRQQAELLSLQSKQRAMFSTLGQELEAHAMARDLTGLRHVRAGIQAMAAKHPGWLPVMQVCDAQYLRLCGDFEAALTSARLSRASRVDASIRSPWVIAAALVEAEVLVELGRAGEALAVGQSVLAECERDGMRYYARGLARALALAEAKLGRFEAAMSRLQAVIAEQTELGVTGLPMGQSYETCARIAIWAGDRDAFQKFSELSAEQYRPGQGSVLGALYEGLLEEARRTGIIEGASGVTNTLADSMLEGRETYDRVTTALSGCAEPGERARRALALLCDGEPPARGHLFLFKEAGLTLAASNVPSDVASDLIAFAQHYIDSEMIMEADETAALPTNAPQDAVPTHHWHDTSGTRYGAVLLAAPLEDSSQFAGVAIVSDEAGDWSLKVGPIANAVARVLIESGDARGVRAA